MSNKDKIVGDLTKGIEFLFKKNKVDYLQGLGTIEKPGTVVVTDGKKKTSYETKNIVIATGSDSAPLPGETNVRTLRNRLCDSSRGRRHRHRSEGPVHR